MTNKKTGEIANEKQIKVARFNTSSWVSASAGSGKTKVLIDRVLNLLLEGADISKIWCITYTKAGASEMTSRINKSLKNFAIMPEKDLEKTLQSLNNGKLDEKTLERYKIKARGLFAGIVDTMGGIKITTIHGLCQSILKRFPIEAGLSPYFKVLDENEAKLLFNEIIEKEILNAYKNSKSEINEEFSYLSEEKSEKSFKEALNKLLKNKIKLLDLWTKYKNFDDFIFPYYAKLGLIKGKRFEEYLKDVDLKKHFKNIVQEINLEKDNEKKLKQVMDAYVDNEPTFFKLFFSVMTKSCTKRDIFKKYNHFSGLVEDLNFLYDKYFSIKSFKETKSLLKIAITIISKYQQSKQNKMALDYDDLIIITKDLLSKREERDWILYRLDNGLDHLLIDEAQDTSPEQWEIIKYLSEEFLSGEISKNRTIFVVGDRKQSIFSFQGARPDNFDKMREFFQNRLHTLNRPFCAENMAISFRSSQGVLDLINMFLKQENNKGGVLGENEKDNYHHLIFDNNSSLGSVVELWDDIHLENDNDNKKCCFNPEREEGETSINKKNAERIVNQIKAILDGEVKEIKRKIKPSDIMILLKSRKEPLINAIVKLCKQKQIPITGIDRFEIKNSMAIKDLLILGDFLLSPFDDLSLAVVLKSPLYGFTEDMIFNMCVNRENKSLLEILKRDYTEIYDGIISLMNMALNNRPYDIFSCVLDGKMMGRKKFMARFGEIVDDVIKEFLQLILKYEMTETPSLFDFLFWIRNTDIEIKRDSDNSSIDAVKIMTVHASKGLQSEVVFLPNAFLSPKNEDYILSDDEFFFLKRKNVRIIDEIEAKEKEKNDEEYRRLLYVAISRAKSMVYIAGQYKKKISYNDNWYDKLRVIFTENKAEKVYNQAIDAEVLRFATADKIVLKKDNNEIKKEDNYEAKIPDWVKNPSEAEPTPTRPLTPSKIDEDENQVSPSDNFRFKRGLLIHKLLEILPLNKNIEQALSYLKSEAKDFSSSQQQEMLDSVLQVMENFPSLFGQNSKSEIPIIGKIGNIVVSGQIDRMVVNEDEVIIVDYKTNRMNKEGINESLMKKYEKQLFLYKQILEKIYPLKKIKAYILWTERLVFTEIL